MEEDDFTKQVWDFFQQIRPNSDLLIQHVYGFPLIKCLSINCNFVLFPCQLVTAYWSKKDMIIKHCNALIKNQNKLICIWEDLWRNKPIQIKTRLEGLFRQRSRIYARQTNLVQLDQEQVDFFLDENHVLGTHKAKFKYGLIFENKLVAVAAFSSARLYYRTSGAKKSAQLIRFANINGHTIVGGLSKLITHFMQLHQIDDVMTYTDLDWSVGTGYSSAGFQFIAQLPSSIFWYNQQYKRYSQQQLERFKLDPNTLHPCFNLGSIKWLFTPKKITNLDSEKVQS